MCTRFQLFFLLNYVSEVSWRVWVVKKGEWKAKNGMGVIITENIFSLQCPKEDTLLFLNMGCLLSITLSQLCFISPLIVVKWTEKNHDKIKSSMQQFLEEPPLQEAQQQ